MLGFELLKLRRSRRPQLALLAFAVFLVLMLLGFYTYAQSRTGGNADFRYTFENRSYFNGLTFAIYAFHFGSLLVLPIFVVAEGGAQLAGETWSRTLGLLLTRPVSKSRLFFTKFLVAAVYTFVLSGLALSAVLLIGLVAVGWGDLDLYPGVLQMAESHQHLSQAEALMRFLYTWPAAALGMGASLGFSFLVSTWMRNPVNATAVAIALYLVLHVVSGVHFFADLRPFLFTSYTSLWRNLFQESIPWAEVGRDAAKLAAFTSLFLALAHVRFRTREEG